MPENLAGFAQLALTISPSDDDLRSDAEAETDHEQHHIVHNGDSRCSKLDLTYPSEEGGVGQSDHLLHHQAYQDRVCHPPDVPVRICHGICHPDPLSVILILSLSS